MEIINAPGRFDTSPRLVAQDVRRQKRQAGVTAIFKTEMADDARAAALSEPGDGWTVTRFAGPDGKTRSQGECAILTKDNDRSVVASQLVLLSDGSGTGRFTEPNYALVVVTKSKHTGRVTLFTGAHLPAHIEGKWAKIPMPERARVKVLFRKGKVDAGVLLWIQSVLKWRAGVMELAAKYHVDDIVVAPDGNVDAHKPWVAEMLRRAWPGLTLAVTKGNDLGKRAVGWALTSMDFKSGRVLRQESSDHEAGVYTLTHINPPKPTPPLRKPPPPFSMCTYNGVRMDHYLKTALQVLERGPLKDLAPLTVYQGDWHPGVGASAGTHDKSGAVDLAPFDFGRKVRAWRTLFGPAWHRLPIPGVWGEHVHCLIESCPELAPMAKTQVVEYHQGLDGLADHAKDPNHFNPHVSWDYEKAWHELNPDGAA